MKNLLPGFTVTQQISAVLATTASHFGENLALISDQQSTVPENQKDEFALQKQDRITFETFFHCQTAIEWLPTLDSPSLNNDSFIQQLKSYINKKDQRAFVFFLSGKSHEFDNQTVFLISDEPQQKDRFFKLRDLIDLWKNRQNPKKNKHLFILADFQGSDSWVNNSQITERNDISIQACSFGENNSRVDFSIFQGLLFNNFFHANDCWNVNFKHPKDALKNDQEQNLAELFQPCFYGNIVETRLIFGLNVGFNSWTEMQEARNNKVQNGHYLGQLDTFYNKITQKKVKLPHGKGAMFLTDNSLIGYGKWNKGYLAVEEKVNMLTAIPSNLAIKNLKIDGLSNLLYGNFIDGYLEGEGEVICSDGGYFKGRIYSGEIQGRGNYTFANGYTYEGVKIGCKSAYLTGVSDKNNNMVEYKRMGNQINSTGNAFDDFGNIFSGKFEIDKLNGEGSILTFEGTKINAIFKDGKIIKLVQVVNFEGEILECNLLEDNTIDGKIHIDNTGNIFQGKLLNGLFSGEGILTELTGNIYQGFFEEGHFQGFGVLKFANKNVFKGHFEKGIRHGKGTLFFFNGDVFEGDFINNIQTGFGIYKGANQDIYTGNFKDGLFCGSGKVEFANGDFYEGEFLKHDDFIKDLPEILTFKVLLDKTFNGKGRFQWKNTDEYIGDFKNGKMEGQGILKKTNGKSFEGIFENDKFQIGTLKWKNGESYQGNFKENKLSGKGKLTCSQGVFEEEFY